MRRFGNSADQRFVLRWLEAPPVAWDAKVTRELKRYGTARIQELERGLDDIAQRAARLSGYLDARGASGCGDNGHADGVKASNDKAAKVRKALGFTYPRQDLNF